MTTASAPAQDRTLVGIGWMVVTSILFVCVTCVVRYLGTEIPAVQAAFNDWRAASGRSLTEISRVLALSIG